MAAGGARQTVTGNLWQARLSDVCGWIKCSWEGISTEIIIDSFKTCSISDILDNIEDSDKEIEDDLEITDISDWKIILAMMMCDINE